METIRRVKRPFMESTPAFQKVGYPDLRVR